MPQELNFLTTSLRLIASCLGSWCTLHTALNVVCQMGSDLAATLSAPWSPWVMCWNPSDPLLTSSSYKFNWHVIRGPTTIDYLLVQTVIHLIAVHLNIRDIRVAVLSCWLHSCSELLDGACRRWVSTRLAQSAGYVACAHASSTGSLVWLYFCIIPIVHSSNFSPTSKSCAKNRCIKRFGRSPAYKIRR